MGGAPAHVGGDRGRRRGALHVRRHRLARADALRPAAPRPARDALARRAARAGRDARVAARRHVPVLQRPGDGRAAVEHRRRDRLRRARLGADLPRGGDARAPARDAEVHPLPAARRRRRCRRSRPCSAAFGTNAAISDFLDGQRTVDAANDISHGRREPVRLAARAAGRARPRARARLRRDERDARRPAHALHGRAGDHHRRAADPAVRRAAAGRAVLLADHARAAVHRAAGRAACRRPGARAARSRGRARPSCASSAPARRRSAAASPSRSPSRSPSPRRRRRPSPSASARKRKRKRR